MQWLFSNVFICILYHSFIPFCFLAKKDSPSDIFPHTCGPQRPLGLLNGPRVALQLPHQVRDIHVALAQRLNESGVLGRLRRSLLSCLTRRQLGSRARRVHAQQIVNLLRRQIFGAWMVGKEYEI